MQQGEPSYKIILPSVCNEHHGMKIVSNMVMLDIQLQLSDSLLFPFPSPICFHLFLSKIILLMDLRHSNICFVGNVLDSCNGNFHLCPKFNPEEHPINIPHRSIFFMPARKVDKDMICFCYGILSVCDLFHCSRKQLGSQDRMLGSKPRLSPSFFFRWQTSRSTVYKNTRSKIAGIFNRKKKSNQGNEEEEEEGNLVMEGGARLEALELLRSPKISLHHVEEPIVVLDGAPWVLHEQRPAVPEAPAHRRAERPQLHLRRRGKSSGAAPGGDLEVTGKVNHREVHRRCRDRGDGGVERAGVYIYLQHDGGVMRCPTGQGNSTRERKRNASWLAKRWEDKRNSSWE